jgi:FixJ family two-component response regulator
MSSKMASMRGALENSFDSVRLEARTYATAREFLDAKLVDRRGCIVLDIRLPDGLAFHTRLTAIGVLLPVVIMTGYGNISMSVRAMKRGPADLLPKPFQDQDMRDTVVASVDRD